MPREENLTAKDWAIMEAVERCPVWRTLKSFNLRKREKLLAAFCVTVQELVEENLERPSTTSLDDFRDWVRRWGQDDDRAQLTLQCQWDNLLRHVMGIMAAMEVWEPLTDTEQGEVAITARTGTEAPEMGGQEMTGHPPHDNVLASAMTHSWPTEDVCFGETSSDHADPGGHGSPAEAE